MKKKDIPIDSGVPLPTSRKNWSDIADTWSVGDSIVVTQVQYTAIRMAAVKKGQKVVSRKSGNKVRVWRTE